jgi:hypothetical protein
MALDGRVMSSGIYTAFGNPKDLLIVLEHSDLLSPHSRYYSIIGGSNRLGI